MANLRDMKTIAKYSSYILFPNMARFLKNSFIRENWKPFNTIIEGRGFQGGWPFSPPEREDQFVFF